MELFSLMTFLTNKISLPAIVCFCLNCEPSCEKQKQSHIRFFTSPRLENIFLSIFLCRKNSGCHWQEIWAVLVLPLCISQQVLSEGSRTMLIFFKKCSNKSVGTGLNYVQVVPSYIYFKRHDDTHALKSCQQSWKHNAITKLNYPLHRHDARAALRCNCLPEHLLWVYGVLILLTKNEL